MWIVVVGYRPRYYITSQMIFSALSTQLVKLSVHLNSSHVPVYQCYLVSHTKCKLVVYMLK